MVRANALLELMDLESSVGNRVAFERYGPRRRSTGPDVTAACRWTTSTSSEWGWRRFGQTRRARTALHAAWSWPSGTGSMPGISGSSRHSKQLAERGQEPPPRQPSELSEAPAVREMEVGLREYALALATDVALPGYSHSAPGGGVADNSCWPLSLE